jgi:hypothetical protein
VTALEQNDHRTGTGHPMAVNKGSRIIRGCYKLPAFLAPPIRACR